MSPQQTSQLSKQKQQFKDNQSNKQTKKAFNAFKWDFKSKVKKVKYKIMGRTNKLNQCDN